MTKLVYKCPGHHQRDGGTYDFMPAKSEDEFNQLLQEGWFPSLPEAIEGVSHAAPTRDELIQQATELGLKFDGRTSDKKLALMIDEALA